MKIYGHDVYYLPREMVTTDRLFREDVLAKFDENYLIEMYLLNYEGFEGDGTLLTKFGVRIAEEATFIVSRRRWEDLVQSQSNNLVSNERPNEGDAIYFPLTQQLFQIKYVENEKPLRPLGDVPTYNLVCELMEFADERLETGIDEIDKIAAENAYSIVHKIVNGIKYIRVINGGSGYGGNTTVTLGPVTGTIPPTQVVPTITSGRVSEINTSNPGSGYTTTKPTVTITGSGTGASAEVILPYFGTFEFGETVYGSTYTADVLSTAVTDSFGISNNSIKVLRPGTGYTLSPLVKISKPDAVTASATSSLLGGIVTGLEIVNPGVGIANITNIATLNGSGSGLRVGVTSDANGEVSNVSIQSAGSNYVVGDIVTISVPSSTPPTFRVTSVTSRVNSTSISNPGSGYTSSPSIVFSEPEDPNGVRATGSAFVSNGSVSGISIVNAGSGYTNPPTITIAEPPKTQATATSVIANGQVTGLTIVTPGQGYVTPPRIVIEPSPSEPKGKVARYDVTNKELELIDIVGTFTAGDTLIGETSWAETVIDTFSSIEIENTPTAENKWFEEEGDKIIDWTEGNPFGEYGNQGVF